MMRHTEYSQRVENFQKKSLYDDLVTKIFYEIPCINNITKFYTVNYIEPYEREGMNAVYCKCCLCLQFCTSFSTLVSVLSFAVHGVS